MSASSGPRSGGARSCGESLAALWLELQGCVILARNSRLGHVEVDLLARQDRLLLVVEVKLRRCGPESSAAALHFGQQLRLRRAASVLLDRFRWADSVRLDQIGIDWVGARAPPQRTAAASPDRAIA
jgi:putative endonuclease